MKGNVYSAVIMAEPVWQFTRFNKDNFT